MEDVLGANRVTQSLGLLTLAAGGATWWLGRHVRLGQTLVGLGTITCFISTLNPPAPKPQKKIPKKQAQKAAPKLDLHNPLKFIDTPTKFKQACYHPEVKPEHREALLESTWWHTVSLENYKTILAAGVPEKAAELLEFVNKIPYDAQKKEFFLATGLALQNRSDYRELGNNNDHRLANFLETLKQANNSK